MNKLILKYFKNSASKEEVERLYAWLQGSDANKEKFMRLRSIWQKTSYKAELEEKGLDVESELEIFRSNIHLLQERKSKRKTVYTSIVSIAAAICLIIGVTWGFIQMQKANDNTITSFAQMNKPTAPVSSTQLILSDQKTIAIDESESDIQYTQENITVNQHEDIAKEESSKFNQLIIPNGKRSTITFSDGTKVWANAGTRLVYPVPFDEKKREIFVDGEIYLEVSKDEKRPFIVKTPDVDVRVLGTRFNVNAYEVDAHTHIALIEGSVTVKGNNKEQTLVPNNLYQYNKIIKEEKITTEDVSKHIAWTRGKMIFDKEKLSIVLKRISRYYGVEVKLLDTELTSYLCSGKLNLRDDLKDVLKGISLSVPIAISNENNEYQINMLIKD